MNIDEFIKKIPRPVLVFTVLSLAVAFFVYNDPLKDECDVKIRTFKNNTKGIISSTKINKKIQFAKLDYAQNICREGNSLGACMQYFDNLNIVAKETKALTQKCLVRYSEELDLDDSLDEFTKKYSMAIRIMALAAWGSQPPEQSDKLGWLNEGHLRTFCSIKKSFVDFAGVEALDSIKARVYNEYPGFWAQLPEYDQLKKAALLASSDEAKKELDDHKVIDQQRPRALKTAQNPGGTMTKDEVYARSLFSVRCDLYL
jgi:hypothetical protein